MTARIAVVTIVHGRHDHLAAMLAGVTRSTEPVEVVSICAIDDPAIDDVAATALGEPPPCVLVDHLDRRDGKLPLATARNRAAAAAIGAGADVLVFLDVDCIPSPGLIGRYRAALASTLRGDGHAVVTAGEVCYLPPSDGGYDPSALDALAEPHPGRPVLGADELRLADDVRLFWSLSFAIRATDWARLGGFDERFLGYGAEDTDFGQRIARADGSLVWVGGARAYHQYHPNPMPPVHHVDDIIANAHVFHDTWGWWPMADWLDDFDRTGLIAFDGQTLRRRDRTRGSAPTPPLARGS